MCVARVGLQRSAMEVPIFHFEKLENEMHTEKNVCCVCRCLSFDFISLFSNKKPKQKSQNQIKCVFFL